MGQIRPVFYYLFVGFFCLLFHLHSIEAQILVRGKLLQANQPLADTRIVIEGVNTPTFTNQEGDFSVTISNDGYYSIRIYAPSGLQVVRREIRSGIYLNINILAPQNQTQTASPESGFFVQGNRDRTRLSRYTLTKEELRRFPGAYGDSLKAVQSLPGVSPATPVGVAPTANLGAQLKIAGISIGPPYSNSTNGPVVLRGSGARASKFFLDGFLLPYPFHLGDQASVVNNDFINGVDVYTGIFPARSGLATGGIVALRGPDAESVTKPAGHFNLAFFLSDAHYEAPLYT
ncbi:MAG: Plug domain-containing protein [Leptonema sp. (in: Bacteria)]|nr:Plug domain-containing protein [Leptonema sp. (in: bacteria)]